MAIDESYTVSVPTLFTDMSSTCSILFFTGKDSAAAGEKLAVRLLGLYCWPTDKGYHVFMRDLLG